MTTAWAGWGLGAWVLLGGTPIALAQSIAPAPDGTGTRITVDGNRIDIGGGSRSGDGANLFHSFQQFNLNSNEIAHFLATPDLRNILGRVVGGDPSRIDGLIQVTGGNPNLFLINPAGLIFGPNARLDVPGSFTATSATGLGFGKDYFGQPTSWWNAFGYSDYARLWGDPSVLSFTLSQPAGILNSGNLSVATGKSLSLIGGTVVSVGTLSAPSGELMVATMPGESYVRLRESGPDWVVDSLGWPPPVSQPSTNPLAPIKPQSIPELLTGQPVTGNALTVLPDGTVLISHSQRLLQHGDIAVQSAHARTATLWAAGNNLILFSSQLQTTDNLNLFAYNTIIGRDTPAQALTVTAGNHLILWGDHAVDFQGLQNRSSRLRSQGDLFVVSQGFINRNIPMSAVGEIFVTSPGINDTFNYVHYLLFGGPFFQYSLSESPLSIPISAQADLSVHISSDKLTAEVAGTPEQVLPLQAIQNNIIDCDKTVRLDCEKKVLNYARRINNYDALNQALYRLGQAHYQAGEYSDALHVYSEARLLAESYKQPQLEAVIESELGNVYGALGQFSESINHYQRALELARLCELTTLESQVLNNLGLIAANQKNFTQSQAYQEQSLSIARQTHNISAQARALTQLGMLYYQNTDYISAKAAQMEALKLAEQVNDRLVMTRILDNLGLVNYALGDYKTAASAQIQALSLAQELGDYHAEARALTNLGDTQYQLKQFDQSIKNLQQAIKIWEQVREKLTTDSARLAIFETQETTYSTLRTVLIADHQYERALEIDERGRSQALLKLLAKQGSQSPNQKAAASEQLSREPSEQIDLQRIRQVARDQAATLITYSIERITVDRNQKREIADIAINIWVVQPSGNVHFRQVPIEPDLPLREQIPIARSFLASRLASRTSRGADPVVSSRTLTPGLRQLDRYLIEPIADLLPEREGDRLIFMPHQDLFLVPFSALQNAQGRYLIERYSLAVAPSIQVLDRTHARANQLRQQGNQAGQPLIVGNPVMPLWPARLGKKSPDRPAPLPNSESEARAVAQMLNVQPLTGANATKNAVLQRLEQASLIHLATHGILDSERGLDSAIALAPMNDGDDGWLTARELLNLDLNAQLVVLSACNTGQGALSGDGIIGLSRSLLAAGVPSAIVTQWAVPDAPTAALMTRFYEFLGQGLDKSAALRQATLVTMQQYPDPIDWAAFTLIGDTH